ncbi:uncharacterized protein STEHIDRAFT_82714 [Stereum hirsutum FP-91666 SS1]|uniref:uncharacterized protein n=1 Tax=Stereum hirsutum (strain FP-91666) TaxID=721885 RepID=UPI000444A5AF|nr:uncharacterized protein STEHIDRAFT_82714 [Stereum hirsutum FP-91666 SS1]EIM83831.1 hypothetical protein STEHIDRAFT_82714 [Stereum hirsutum FP-91666 SS1]
MLRIPLAFQFLRICGIFLLSTCALKVSGNELEVDFQGAQRFFSQSALTEGHISNEVTGAGDITAPIDSGVLRRFTLLSETEMSEVLQLAEKRDWDVWQATPQHVDIFFPRQPFLSDSSSSPHSLQDSFNHLAPYAYHDTAIPRVSLPTMDLHTSSQTELESDPWNLSSLADSTFYSTYHTLDDIYAFMHDLAAQYPEKITLVPLGHTGEGREMYAMEIRTPSADDNQSGANFNFGGEEDLEKEKGATLRDELPPAELVGNEEWSQGVHAEKNKDNKSKKGKKGKKPKGKNGRRRKDKERVEIGGKAGFIITGAQHAREWVATASALYLAHALAANTSESESLGHLLDKYDFYLVPVPNPDGHVYTWEHDRFWYKNRLDLGPQAKCTGIDMNRNWGYKWKSSFASLLTSEPLTEPQPHNSITEADNEADNDLHITKKKTKNPKKSPDSPGSPPDDTCHHWYPGHRPFQAPEVNNMANYFERLADVKLFVDLRSYGQMISAPYSHSCKRTPLDAEDQLEAASGAAAAAKKSNGTSFQVGTLCSTLYKAPGNIVDWMYARKGVKYSYAAHLRDTGTYGFALPPNWIRPAGAETAKMLEYLAKFVATKENIGKAEV